MTRKWLQSQDVSVDDATGALLVQLLTDSSGALLVNVAPISNLVGNGLSPATIAAGTSARLVPAWATGTNYTVGQAVLDASNLTWVCTTAHTAGASFDPTKFQQITTCRFVWVGAPCDANGTAKNLNVAFIGAAATANEPNMPLLIANFEGFSIPTNDPSKIYVQPGHTGDQVAFRIFSA
jgi:hypothetical protein